MECNNLKTVIIFLLSIFVIVYGAIKIIDNGKETKTYEVSFDSNGGSKVSTQTIKEGEKIKKPIEPTKEGHIFIEWIYQGQTYDFSLEVTSDLTLEAKWEVIQENIEKYVIKFDTDGGNTIPNQIVENGFKIIEPSEPTKTGYIFDGWYNGKTKFDFNIEPTSNLTLTAKWKIDETKVKKYTVTFDSNGGSSVSSQSITKGLTVTKPTDPTRKGYTFEGWYNGNTKFDFNTKITSNLILTAKWKENTIVEDKYTVTFDSNGGSSVSSQSITKGSTVTKPTDPTRNGYTFEGWYNGEIKFDFNTKITSNLILTAKWKENIIVEGKYTVTFDSNGGSSVSSQTVKKGLTATKPSNPTRTGYTFVNWTLNGKEYNFNTPITSNITLVANWSSDEWVIDSTGAIIKYKGNDAEVIIPEKINGIKPTSIKANAFQTTAMTSLYFSSGITTVANEAILKSNNKKLMNVYMTDNQYKGISNTNLKIFGMSGSSLKSTDSKTFIVDLLTKGCNLSGDNCNTSNMMYIKNISGVYPYSLDTSACNTIISSSPKYYLTTEPLKIINLNVIGYRFLGWTGSNGSTPQKDLVIPAGSTGEKKYFANCVEHTWSIRLNYENYLSYSGTLDYSNVNYNESPYCGSKDNYCKFRYSESVKIPYNRVKRSGYKFIGWATSTTGTVKYKEGETVSRVVSQDGGVLTLYARWEKE